MSTTVSSPCLLLLLLLGGPHRTWTECSQTEGVEEAEATPDRSGGSGGSGGSEHSRGHWPACVVLLAAHLRTPRPPRVLALQDTERPCDASHPLGSLWWRSLASGPYRRIIQGSGPAYHTRLQTFQNNFILRHPPSWPQPDGDLRSDPGKTVSIRFYGILEARWRCSLSGAELIHGGYCLTTALPREDFHIDYSCGVPTIALVSSSVHVCQGERSSSVASGGYHQRRCLALLHILFRYKPSEGRESKR